jgi:p21-activated kinase 1
MSEEVKNRKIQRSKSVDLTSVVNSGSLNSSPSRISITPPSRSLNSSPSSFSIIPPSRSLNSSPSRMSITPTRSEENTPRNLLKLLKNRSLPKIISTNKSDQQIDPLKVQFHEKIGDGGCSEIFAGSVNNLGLAIKYYRQPINNDDDLMREISILSGLNHPRIIHYIGFSIEKNQKLLMLMELCRGTVHQLSSESSIDILEVFKQVAEGLVYLHSQNVIHRDIKSENIFYSIRLNRETLKQEFDFKIGDFDTAVKCIDLCQIEDAPNLGTMEFRAPEIIRPSSSERVCYTDKVDNWAFGMLVFELVFNDIPYRYDFGMNFNAIERAIVSGIKPTVSKRRMKRKLAHLYELYDFCLCTDPIVRPNSQQILDFILDKKDAETLDLKS